MDETAYHEAGHIVISIVLGARVVHATIEPDRDDGPERFGDVRILWRRDRLSPKKFAENIVLSALAGPVAEMIYTGEPYHPGFVAEWADDWQQAFTAAAVIVPDDRKRLAWLEERIRSLYESCDKQYWPAIAALADELSAHETLEEEMILAAIEPWI